jgi:hypothetical protein
MRGSFADFDGVAKRWRNASNPEAREKGIVHVG